MKSVIFICLIVLIIIDSGYSAVSIWPPPLSAQFGSHQIDGVERIHFFFPPSSLSKLPGERRFQKRLLQSMVDHFFQQLRIESGGEFHFSSCKPSDAYLSICASIPSTPFFPFPNTSFFPLPSNLLPNAIPFGENEAYRMHCRTFPSFSSSSSSSSSPFSSFSSASASSPSSSPAIFIAASSVWGVLRALQSAAQLFVFSPPHPVPFVRPLPGPPLSLAGLPFLIYDRPAIPHRGVLVDLPRNHYPLETLRSLVDFLAACKLNVLHLRLADDQGFMLEIASFPGLAKPPVISGPGARVYSVAEMKGFVAYARNKGVRIVPELDMPTHAGGWGIIPPKKRNHNKNKNNKNMNMNMMNDRNNLNDYDVNNENDDENDDIVVVDMDVDVDMDVVVEDDQDNILLSCPSFACSTAWSLMLNPFKPRTYEVIEAVLGVVADVFPDPFLHLGGDEVAHGCISEAGVSMEDYASTFEEALFALVRRAVPHKRVVRWQEILAEHYLPWDAAALWTSAMPPRHHHHLQQHQHHGHDDSDGMPLILSHGWYVDYAKQCLTAAQCYGANTWLPSPARWLGAELSLWEMTPRRVMEADVHSQIVGFCGAAWMLTGRRPAYDAAQAAAFCAFLARSGVVDPALQCHLHEERSGHAYHEKWRAEFKQREVERDTLVCQRYDPDGQCWTHNCVPQMGKHLFNWLLNQKKFKKK